MGWLIWGIVLPSCLVAAWWIVRKPIRLVVEEMGIDRAHLLFRQRREWLEARFLSALGRTDPIERLRWEGAGWQDRVHWARDNRTRRLLALVEIRFDPDPFGDPDGPQSGHATALFEYRKGRWLADGKWLDAMRPDEAFLRNGRFEPVEPPHRRA